MFGLSYKDIVEKIVSSTGLKEDEVNEKVNTKLKLLSDLISKEGAAHIIANELGVKLIDVDAKITLNKLRLGMHSVNFNCRVLRVFDIHSFSKNGKEGKVVNLFVGDEFGKTKLVFWDVNHIKLVESGKIKENSILTIKKGYVRVNNNFTEVHLGNKAEIEIDPSKVKVDVVEKSSMGEYVRKSVNELRAGDFNVGILGTIVQIFEPKFFDACPECRKKVVSQGDSYVCTTHGNVKGEVVPILNVFIDDSTDSIRLTAFRNLAEQILGITSSGFLEIKSNPNNFEDVRNKALGNQFIFVGRVVKNDMYDRDEFMVTRVLEANPEKLINEMSDS